MKGRLGCGLMLALLLGCWREPTGAARVLARVGSEEITVADVEKRIAIRSEGEPAGFDRALRRPGLLEEVIREEALVQRAIEAVFDEDPRVQAVWRHALVTQFREDAMRDRLSSFRVEDESVRQTYEASIDDYTRPERRRMGLI